MPRMRLLALAGAIGLTGALGLAGVVGASPAAHHRGAQQAHLQKKKPKHKHKKHAVALRPHVGQVAKDGDFAFTITQVQCGVTHLGTSAGLGETAPAGSQWCLVSMTVKDDKSASQTFFASNQYAIDVHGDKLSATTSALIYMSNDSAAELSAVNPGVMISVVVPFELASSDSIKEFQLHDSAFSNGVTVYNAA